MAQSLLEIVSSTLEPEMLPSPATGSTPPSSAAGSRTSERPSGFASDGAGQVALVRAGQVIKPGDLIGGKYRVERVLSHTGLLCAVQVRHLVLETQATLKYLTPEARAFPEAISSFLRGARLLSQLHTEHIAAVLDVGMLEIGTPYLVMEHPEGPDFAQVIRVRGALPVEEARIYVKQICEGLAQAHALGLIHGMLRPGCVVLTKRQDGLPIACITDFGNTGHFDFEQLTRTDDGLRTAREVLEVVRYLSPDHARFPDNLDARSDVWAIGAMLQELLTGQPAFSAKTSAGLLAAIAADAPVALRALRPDVSEGLDSIVRCCLAKQREARLPNGSQLLRALEISDDFSELSRPTRSSFAPAASDAPLQVTVPPAAPLPTTSSVAVASRSTPPTSAPAPASQAPAPATSRSAVVAVALGLVVGSGAFLAYHKATTHSDRAASADEAQLRVTVPAALQPPLKSLEELPPAPPEEVEVPAQPQSALPAQGAVQFSGVPLGSPLVAQPATRAQPQTPVATPQVAQVAIKRRPVKRAQTDTATIAAAEPVSTSNTVATPPAMKAAPPPSADDPFGSF